MRVLFTVALVVAVLAVALPAVEYVGVDRSVTETRDAVERLEGVARSLAAGNDALDPSTGPARRVVAVDLPGGGFASARLDRLTIGPPERSARSVAATRIAWRVEGGSRHVVQLDRIRLRGADGGEFDLGPGRGQRLVLRLVSRNGTRVVRVSRQSGP